MLIILPKDWILTKERLGGDSSENFMVLFGDCFWKPFNVLKNKKQVSNTEDIFNKFLI